MIHYCLSIHTSNTLVYQELLSLAVIMQSYVVFNVALIFMGLNCISDWVELWSEHRLHHGCRIAELWPIPDQGTILDRLRFTWRRYDFTIQSHNLSKNLYNEKRKVLLTDNLNKIEIQSIEMKAPATIRLLRNSLPIGIANGHDNYMQRQRRHNKIMSEILYPNPMEYLRREASLSPSGGLDLTNIRSQVFLTGFQNEDNEGTVFLEV